MCNLKPTLTRDNQECDQCCFCHKQARYPNDPNNPFHPVLCETVMQPPFQPYGVQCIPYPILAAGPEEYSGQQYQKPLRHQAVGWLHYTHLSSVKGNQQVQPALSLYYTLA